ncbi:SDR family NAD(P)-dependent oxidoreductase [Sphingomonas sp. 35-24ZXX]|uniref:SDR family NAD(P)-dependent oxidoreductase n=1 Tax=Sphingomonas sp. 35-24ZXX TaxID=1545915 RepID=UPI00053C054B|nr:SDR family NAD(P)-dependent oxidoreductase [Sphingomonas sp. 35-24ZXX]
MTAVAIVTGASRGAGRGIAIALGSHGCTVYVTGRSDSSSDTGMPGTIHETAAAVTAAGGKGVAIRCDHADDAQVQALFDRVARDASRLDILVNNACAIQDALHAPGQFWEKPLSLSQMIDVGVRSSYVASWHAARAMVRQGSGLIAFTSSPGSVHYCMGPAYGAHKAGLDKLAADMAVDLRDTGVSAISVWMGALASERLLAMIEADPQKYGHLPAILEPTEYTGQIIWALSQDPELTSFSGQTLIGAELGRRYGITRQDGSFPPSARDTHGVEPRIQYPLIIR